MEKVILTDNDFDSNGNYLKDDLYSYKDIEYHIETSFKCVYFDNIVVKYLKTNTSIVSDQSINIKYFIMSNPYRCYLKAKRITLVEIYKILDCKLFIFSKYFKFNTTSDKLVEGDFYNNAALVGRIHYINSIHVELNYTYFSVLRINTLKSKYLLCYSKRIYNTYTSGIRINNCFVTNIDSFCDDLILTNYRVFSIKFLSLSLLRGNTRPIGTAIGNTLYSPSGIITIKHSEINNISCDTLNVEYIDSNTTVKCNKLNQIKG